MVEAAEHQIRKYYSLLLSYELRSEDDQAHGCQRVSSRQSAFQRNPQTSLFEDDLKAIQRSAPYKNLTNFFQIAPSHSTFFESRGSHTEEVIRVSEKIARRLGLSQESIHLTKAIAAQHDIGHLPFSHEGEEVVNELLEKHGVKFDHDHAGLDIVCNLLNTKDSPAGMEPTVAVVEGAVKRYVQKFLSGLTEETHYVRNKDKLPDFILEIDEKYNLHLDKCNHIEGQVAAISDWVAFTVTDIADVLKLMLRSPDYDTGEMKEFFDGLMERFPLAKESYEELKGDLKSFFAKRNDAGNKDQYRITEPEKGNVKVSQIRVEHFIKQFSAKLENKLIDDVVMQTEENLEENAFRINKAEHIRDLDKNMVAFSDGLLSTMVNDVASFFKHDVYPKITENHLDVKAIFRVVFQDFLPKTQTQMTIPFTNEAPDDVEKTYGGFFVPEIKMPQDWDKALQEIMKDGELSQPEKEKKAILHVARYMSANLSDWDVMSLFKAHHKEQYDRMMVSSKRTALPDLAYQPPGDAFQR